MRCRLGKCLPSTIAADTRCGRCGGIYEAGSHMALPSAPSSKNNRAWRYCQTEPPHRRSALGSLSQIRTTSVRRHLPRHALLQRTSCPMDLAKCAVIRTFLGLPPHWTVLMEWLQCWARAPTSRGSQVLVPTRILASRQSLYQTPKDLLLQDCYRLWRANTAVPFAQRGCVARG